MKNFPKVTVVTLVKDNTELTFNFLDSLNKYTKYPNFNVLLGDTGSTKENLEALKGTVSISEALDISIVELGEYSYGKNMNKLVRNHLPDDTQYVCFMDNDIDLCNDCISIFMDVERREEKVATYTPCLLFKTGEVQCTGYMVEAYEDKSHRLMFQNFNVHNSDVHTQFEVLSGCGSLMMVNRDIFEDLGGFNLGYKHCLYDVDLCIRAAIAGYKNLCPGYASAKHFLAQTRGKENLEEEFSFDMTRLSNLIYAFPDELNPLLTHKERVLNKADWGIYNTSELSSNYEGPQIFHFQDISIAENMEKQMDFETRYNLKSNDGKLHIVGFGHDNGCGYVRLDLPAKYINRRPDMEMFTTQKMCPELANWGHVFVWEAPPPNDFSPMRDIFAEYSVPQMVEIDDNYLEIDKFNKAKYMIPEELVSEWFNKCGVFTTTRDSLRDFYISKYPDMEGHTLPNCVDHEVFLNALYDTSDTGPLKLGWMGCDSHFSDLLVVTPVLKRLQEEYGRELDITLFGWDGKLPNNVPFKYNGTDNVMDGIRFTHIPYVPIQEYHSFIQTLGLDVMFLPLADINFNNNGKSPVKFLEAASAKMPCVVSDSSVFNFLTHGEDALLCKTEEDWYTNIKAMLDNAELRRKISANGYNTVMNKFSMENNVDKWVDVYTQLATSKYKQYKRED